MAIERYEFRAGGNSYLFEYDYEHNLVLWVDDDGTEIDAVGLSRQNWDDIEAREEYLLEWVWEIEDAMSHMDLEEFM